MKKISHLIYRLGGADYEVIKTCSSDTQTKYQNLGLSLLLTSILAFIGGYDVASQFTTSKLACAVVGLLWALAVFSFDYFLLNAGTVSKFFKFIRIPVGFASVFITITALFVLMNQASIDGTIREETAKKIAAIDNEYLIGKENRYRSYNERKTSIEKYHQQSCLPEALNVRPGKIYDAKHTLCITTHRDLSNDLAILHDNETSYYNTYQEKKQAKSDVKFNDFFVKAKQLPAIFKGNHFIAILAVCTFIFLGYIELQCIILKFSIDPNDEYHTALVKLNKSMKDVRNKQIETRRLQEEVEAVAENQRAQINEMEEKHKAMREKFHKLILIQYELNRLKKITSHLQDEKTLQKINEYEKEIAEYVSNLKETLDPFKMTESMHGLVEQISAQSNKDNLAINLFKWVINNIEYDTNHSKEFYRSAAETFNNKKGLCGELSVLLISLYRNVGITANYVKVTKDDTGKAVNHACVHIVNCKDEIQLVDPAYKIFDIKHISWELIFDENLKNNYNKWNN